MNNKNNLQYKRLFVLNPSYYKKLTEAYEERSQLNDFGKEISDILFNKNLTDTQKYYFYLKNLSDRMTQIKPSEDSTENKASHITDILDLTKTEQLKTEQLLPKAVASIETQVSPKKLRNKSIQTDLSETVFNATLNPPLEEIFENKIDSVPVQNEENVDVNKHPSRLSDFYLEEKLHEIAQKYSGERNMNNIVLDDARSKNHKDFRIFSNIKTKDEIAVEIQPVYDLLYNNKDVINWKVYYENRLLEGQYIMVYVNEDAIPMIENKRKRKADDISENVLEKTLHELAYSNTSPDTSLTDLVVDRESIDSNFRIFNDNTSGKKIVVEVAPVYNYLLNKTKSLEIDLDETNKDFVVLRSRKIQKNPSPALDVPKKKRKKEKSQKGGNFSLQWTII